MSPYFNIKFSDSDIPSLFQIRWTTETKTRNESILSHKVFRFRCTPPFADKVNNWDQNQKWVHMFMFYCHFQLLSLCNWLCLQVHPVYKIQSLLGLLYNNMKRPSVKQSIKWQVCSNFQMKYPDKLSDIPPPKQNCQWQEMKSLLIYVVKESPFEMDSGIGSSFQMKCTTRWTC